MCLSDSSMLKKIMRVFLVLISSNTKVTPDLHHIVKTGKSGVGIKMIKSGNFSIKSYVVGIY